MTDRAAPKAKKTKPDDNKLPGPKLVAGVTPGIGHNSAANSGEKHPEAVKCLDELLTYQVQKKAIAAAERDIRRRLKSEFNILASSVSRELSLRKLEPDVRVQVETNHEDFKKMLGYKPSLDFAGDKPTDASLKAQPSEADFKERNTEPSRKLAPLAVDEDDEGDDESVITREG